MSNADIYVDYLLVATGQASATNLSAMLDHKLSHDQFAKVLSEKEF
jgi:hypothetical protein